MHNRQMAPRVSLGMTSSLLPMTTPARLMLCAATLAVLVGCASQDTQDASDPAAAPSASPTEGPEPELIYYPDEDASGTEVRSMSDANALAGAPDSFKAFIGGMAEQLVADSTCTDGYVGITVKALRTDGYATGGVNDCGGYVALWALVDGEWQEVDGTQGLWNCATLTEHQVPSDIAGTSCYDRDANAQVDYQQA